PLKRLTERAGASPVVSEGRIFFLTGKIGGPGDGALPYVGETVVWSVGPEGGEGRLEMRLSLGSEMRLDGRWPDGRYLVHLARDRTQWLASTRLVTQQRAMERGTSGRRGSGGASLCDRRASPASRPAC